MCSQALSIHEGIIFQPMCDVYREVFSSNFKGAEVAKCIEVCNISTFFAF